MGKVSPLNTIVIYDYCIIYYILVYILYILYIIKVLEYIEALRGNPSAHPAIHQRCILGFSHPYPLFATYAGC